MPLDPDELRRPRMAMAKLQAAAFYLGRIEGDGAKAMVAAIFDLLGRCKAMLEG